MRLKSEIWVQAFVRRCAVEGKYCTIVARGAAEAGAVFIIVNRLDGRFHLFGTGALGGDNGDQDAFVGDLQGIEAEDARGRSDVLVDGDRRFVDELPFPSQESEVMALLERRRKFDSDIWIVEVEDRGGAAGIEIAQL